MNDPKAGLSLACVAALAVHVKCICQGDPQPVEASVDATILPCGATGTRSDVQLQTTLVRSRGTDGLHFKLSGKNYTTSVVDRMTSLLPIVHELPSADADWSERADQHVTMRRCGWWASLSGRAPTDGETTTIVIPEDQRIGASGTASLVAVARGQTHE